MVKAQMSGHVKTSQRPQKHLRPQRVKDQLLQYNTDTDWEKKINEMVLKAYSHRERIYIYITIIFCDYVVGVNRCLDCYNLLTSRPPAFPRQALNMTQLRPHLPTLLAQVGRCRQDLRGSTWSNWEFDTFVTFLIPTNILHISMYILRYNLF